MPTTYAQKQSTAQKKDANTAASVMDHSSQGESLQRKADLANGAVQRAEVPRPNNTGMPDNLKAGIESLSGFSMDDVRVHYNSSKPATVQALAYTQGTDIHVAPGQEKYLPHEAWHVAQQMAGRVSPTTNINGMPVNDNAALEHEADIMGEKAVKQMKCECFGTQVQKKINVDCKQRMPARNMAVFYNDYVVLDKNGSVKELAFFINSPTMFFQNGVTLKYSSVLGANSKIDALQKISEKAAILGNCLPDCLFKNGEFIRVVYESTYQTQKNKKTKNISLTYQFGKAWTGYIMNVKTEKEGRKPLFASLNDKGKGGPGKYSNRHARSSISIINDTSRNDTSRNDPSRNDPSRRNGKRKFQDSVPDAYTKLAGEGARFQCVRRNMQWINDDTVFYKPTYDPDKRGVAFKELWKTWSASFGKKYDIKDNEIVTAMGGGNTLAMLYGTTHALPAEPGNRVKLDGESTIESEKNHVLVNYFHKKEE